MMFHNQSSRSYHSSDTSIIRKSNAVGWVLELKNDAYHDSKKHACFLVIVRSDKCMGLTRDLKRRDAKPVKACL